MGTAKGRKARKEKHGEHLKVGICGEHGGDPDSVVFCHKVGMDYVSCSPFRVPIARLAAAQAALAGGGTIAATSNRPPNAEFGMSVKHHGPSGRLLGRPFFALAGRSAAKHSAAIRMGVVFRIEFAGAGRPDTRRDGDRDARAVVSATVRRVSRSTSGTGRTAAAAS